MDWALAPITSASVVSILAGVAMLVLAGWTWYLHPRLAVNRAFAGFLVLRGMTNITTPVAFRLDAEPGRLYLLGGVLDLFLVLALVPFLLAYRRHQHGSGPGRWVYPTLAVGAVAMATAWILNPAWGPYRPDGEAFSFQPGPLLVLVSPLYWGVLVAMGLVLARDATLAEQGPAQSSNLLLALGLMAWPIHQCTFILLDLATGGALAGTPVDGRVALVFRVPLVFFASSGFLATVLLYRGARSRGRPPLGQVRRFALAVLVPFLAVVVLANLALSGLLPRLTALHAFEFAGSTWILAMPLLAAYALVRHQLFGVDVRVKWTIRQSTVAAVFLTVFFVVSEGAQQLFSERIGPFLGIVAAGALLFALAPLQRVAERVADAAMPGVKDLPQMDHEERLHIYRDQARFAWSDRSLSPDERAMLDQLRERLGLSAEDAVRIEGEVARG